MNTSYLHDKEYVDKINATIDRIVKDCETLDAKMRWEMIKNEVILESMDYAVIEAKEGNKQINQLYSKLQQLNIRVDGVRCD